MDDEAGKATIDSIFKDLKYRSANEIYNQSLEYQNLYGNTTPSTYNGPFHHLRREEKLFRSPDYNVDSYYMPLMIAAPVGEITGLGLSLSTDIYGQEYMTLSGSLGPSLSVLDAYVEILQNYVEISMLTPFGTSEGEFISDRLLGGSISSPGRLNDHMGGWSVSLNGSVFKSGSLVVPLSLSENRSPAVEYGVSFPEATLNVNYTFPVNNGLLFGKDGLLQIFPEPPSAP